MPTPYPISAPASAPSTISITNGGCPDVFTDSTGLSPCWSTRLGLIPSSVVSSIVRTSSRITNDGKPDVITTSSHPSITNGGTPDVITTSVVPSITNGGTPDAFTTSRSDTLALASASTNATLGTGGDSDSESSASHASPLLLPIFMLALTLRYFMRSL